MYIENNEKSVFDHTMELLDMRMSLYHSKYSKTESDLYNNNNPSNLPIRTFSQLSNEHAYYSFQTPVDPKMKAIYEKPNDFAEMNKEEPKKFRYILEPASDGENSITSEHSYFEPSFNWLCSRFIDSSLLKTDTVEAKKVDRDKKMNVDRVPEEWKNVKEVMVRNLKKKFEIDNDIDNVISYIKGKFEIFPWVKLKRAKFIYHKGKPALIFKYLDEGSAIFAHYYFKTNINSLRDYFGEDFEIFRVLENKLKEKKENWIAVIFRKLPNNFTKENLISLLKKHHLTIIWLEQLIEIEDNKYALAGVEYLDQAFEICNFFRESQLYRDLRVNLHPNSTKIWKPHLKL